MLRWRGLGASELFLLRGGSLGFESVRGREEASCDSAEELSILLGDFMGFISIANSFSALVGK